MYTIKQAAARSGISVPLVRAWERRYGVVHPERTPAGYRLYDANAIAVLSSMRRLVDSGWSPSEAARAIREGTVPVEQPEEDSSGARDEPPAALVTRFVEAAMAVSAPEVESALDEIFSRGSYEATVDRILMPALAAIGDAWEAGELYVAGEHLASAAVMRRLTAAFNAAGPPMTAGVLVGTPPGSLHELGPLAFSAALRRQGVPVTYLGADVPVASWVDAARHSSATGAVIGIATGADVAPAGLVVEALHAALPSLLIGVGGRAAADLPDEAAGHFLLPLSIAGSAREMAARLAVPPRRRSS